MITSLQNFMVHLIKESAKSYADLDNIIVIKRETNKEIKIVLYNITTLDIISYIHASKVKGFVEIERISSEQGYGPLTYDLLLMSVYPLGVKPSSLIKDKALAVWKYYQNQRTDVKKELVDTNKPYYSATYKTDDHGRVKSDPESLKLINTLYFKEPTQDYIDLMNKSEQAIKNSKIDVNRVIKLALDHFWSKYAAY